MQRRRTLSQARKDEWANSEIRKRRSESISKSLRDNPNVRSAAKRKFEHLLRDPEFAATWKAAQKRNTNPYKKHGMWKSNEHHIWRGITQRCTNPKNAAYRWYGGRGIKICDEWQGETGFAAFFAHVGERPSKAHSLDRIDNNGHYEPGNVRWVTQKEQMRNSRAARAVTINGITKSVAGWAEYVGVRPCTMTYRLSKSDDPEYLLRHPESGRRLMSVAIDGVSCSIAEWARRSGLKPGTIARRYRAGDRGEALLRPVRGVRDGG